MDFKDFAAGANQDHFWFKAKTQLIEQLCQKAATQKSMKILSVGAGTGEDLACFKKMGSVYAIDIDQNALDLIPASLIAEKKQADACDIPYSDAFFDMVVAFDVIEHIQDDQKMVEEVHRLLKKGGSFVFTVPAFNFLFGGHDRALNHYRRYNKTMMKRLMTNFKKETLGYWFFWLFFPAVVKRLLSRNSPSAPISCFPKLVNRVFYTVLSSENKFISRGISFPFGLSLYGIYKK